MKLWTRYLDEADKAVLEKGRFGARMGMGSKPCIVAIDCQKYMVGEEGRDAEWPSSCGEAGRAALRRGANLVAQAQNLDIPVFFTLFELDPNGTDIGIYGRKRELLDSQHWCLANTRGAELTELMTPSARDIVFVKKKPSGFHGTPLLGYLVDRGIDTVIVIGGATSNCVRATVFDSSSYNFRTIVAEDAVFDRIPVSHAISLFDMDRQFADVMPVDDILATLKKQYAAA
jgi:nicotinamidase-related amidase